MIRYIYYLIYYLIFILSLIIILSKFWNIKELIRGIFFVSSSKKRERNELKKNVDKIKYLQVFLVIFLLISLPAMSFISSSLSDFYMRRDPTMVSGSYYENCHNGTYNNGTYIRDPVVRSIEADFDSDAVIEKMKDDSKYWHTEDILDEIDLREMCKIPGKLSVYRMKNTIRDDIVITYTYYAPLPITKAFGFRVTPNGEDVYLLKEHTTIYPMNPGDTDPLSSDNI